MGKRNLKILVIGSGGREHALVWKIAQSKRVKKVYCAPGNAGTESLAVNIPIPIDDLDGLLDFAKRNKIDLTIVGPEAPLIEGIVDLFDKYNLPIIGPNRKAAQTEGSKIFAKKLMHKYKIPTAKFAVFDDYNYAKTFLKSQNYPLVIKADGQCLGKGVKVCIKRAEAQEFLESVMKNKFFGEAGSKVIIEECLYGQEVSFMVATDGKNFVSLLPSRDHKRVFDGDRGPNTGGIGAYAPVPFVDKKLICRIEKEIVAPTIDALAKEGCFYSGILYPGLILTNQGPKVLEFNCRFGDPETQPVLSLLKSDIIDLFEAIAYKRIDKVRLQWKKGSAVCVILASQGYPGNYEKGKEIFGVKKLTNHKDILLFHAGTKRLDNKIVTNGGRVLGITALGANLKSAIYNCYKYIGKNEVNFYGMHYRKDIGLKGI